MLAPKRQRTFEPQSKEQDAEHSINDNVNSCPIRTASCNAKCTPVNSLEDHGGGRQQTSGAGAPSDWPASQHKLMREHTELQQQFEDSKQECEQLRQLLQQKATSTGAQLLIELTNKRITEVRQQHEREKAAWIQDKACWEKLDQGRTHQFQAGVQQMQEELYACQAELKAAKAESMQLKQAYEIAAQGRREALQHCHEAVRLLDIEYSAAAADQY